MPVAILGTLIIFGRDNSKFKVVIGDGNDIDDLKLWSVNTDQTISKEILNDELEDPAKTIGETFLGFQGGNIRVVVRATCTDRPFHSAV
ncbi:hypothetical protein C1646_758876 [Rhizophagus diaphanus]|nr:hypothetical protein C1646_758876 [Rhizophagus diaphanus] [Rhizophagus sp. MUCL 43196]